MITMTPALALTLWIVNLACAVVNAIMLINGLHHPLVYVTFIGTFLFAIFYLVRFIKLMT